MLQRDQIADRTRMSVNHGGHKTPVVFLFYARSFTGMIAAQNITLAYGKRTLFKDVNIKFTAGNCYGLIGANGAGKSTFLKILAGQLDADKGEVFVGARERIAYLNQDQFAFDEETVAKTVLMGHTRLHEVIAEREA